MSAIEFQSKLRDLVGSKYAETIDLIQKFGIEVLTKSSKIEAEIGSLKIKSIEQAQPDAVRQFQFMCEIDGKPMVEVRKIELDPIDYTSGEIFTAKITIVPIIGMVEEGGTDEGPRTD